VKISVINLVTIQARAVDMQKCYNNLTKETSMFREHTQKKSLLRKKIQETQNKHIAIMKKTSQNPSEEQTLRRNEAKYELEIQNDDKKLTEYAGSIAAHTDEITKFHGQFEIFFPTFVFNPRIMDKDLENVRLLIETEQNNTAKISAQLTTLNQQLKEGKEILES